MNWLQKMAQQKLLIIARGPSGSGKSYMVKKLARQYGTEAVFSTDDFWKDPQTGEYQFNEQYIDYAHFQNQSNVEGAMQGDEPVIIVDNTNTTFEEMKPYVLMAQKYGYNPVFKEPEREDFKEPGKPDIPFKTEDGRWNVAFLEKMQHQPDRDKAVPLDKLVKMVNQYEYGPTEEAVLRSERPGRPD